MINKNILNLLQDFLIEETIPLHLRQFYSNMLIELLGKTSQGLNWSDIEREEKRMLKDRWVKKEKEDDK